MKRPAAHWVCFCISQSNVSNQIRIKSQSLKTWKTQHSNHLVEEKVIFSSSLYVKTVTRSRSKITIAFFQFLTMRWWQLLRHHSGKKWWKFCWHNLFPIMQHRHIRGISYEKEWYSYSYPAKHLILSDPCIFFPGQGMILWGLATKMSQGKKNHEGSYCKYGWINF